MAELNGTRLPDGHGYAPPCRLVLKPEAKQEGPGGRTVMYLLRLGEEESDPPLHLRGGMAFADLARLGRSLRRLVRAEEPFDGLALGWALAVSGERSGVGFNLLLLPAAGAEGGHAIQATGPAIEAFVDQLEGEVMALP